MRKHCSLSQIIKLCVQHNYIVRVKCWDLKLHVVHLFDTTAAVYSVTCIVSDMKLQNFTLLGHSTCGAYDAGYCYECSVVCARVSLCLCVGHIAEHAEKADANRDTICDVDYGWPKEPCIR